MPNSPVIPTVRRRRLGSSLRKLRNDAELTLETAAAAMGWKAPKLSKIENARQHIRPTEVAALLTAYGVSESGVYAALENLARDAGKKGWWQTYSGVVSASYGDYISLESDADRIISWSPLLVPGLLQTPGYARETISGITTTRTPDEINALVEVRQARQAVLSRPGQPLDLWAVIHEAALHKRFAARPTTMRDQLCCLSEICELPNVTLQLMPLNSTAHPGLLGSFLLATFPGPTPDAALLENVAGATYVEGEDTGPFASALDRIRAAALSVEDTMVRIGQLAEGQGK